MSDANNTTKVCGTCRISKPTSDFSANKSKKDGLQYRCRECAKAYRDKNSDRIQAYLAEYRAQNREKAAETTRQWRQSNPERARAGVRAYYQENKDKLRGPARRAWEEQNRPLIRAIAQKTYLRNVEKYRAKNRAHYEANKELYRARDRNRHALELSSEGSHTAEEILMLLANQVGLCAVPSCRIPLVLDGPNKFHADHMVPLSRSGSNYIANIQLLCPTCNKSKGAKTMDEYLEWLQATKMTC